MREDRMPLAGKALILGLGASLALAGCAAESVQTVSAAPAPAEAAAGQAHPGAAVRIGQTGGMAAVYARPRLGPVAGAGASAWVAPAPPPAFVVADLPPPAPPAPPPAAVANRQPAAPPAPGANVDASQIVRPEAAAPEAPAPAPALSETTRQEGRRLFTNSSCGTCHALADAGATGAIGPSLDNPGLTRDYVIDVVSNGQGAMPSFAGQMSDEEIATLADYIVGAARR